MEKTPAGPTDSAHHAGLHVAATEGKDIREQPSDHRDGQQQQPSPQQPPLHGREQRQRANEQALHQQNQKQSQQEEAKSADGRTDAP
jgi:hypothetical protein